MTVLESNTYQKKSISSQTTDILRDLQSQPIFLEYKDTIIELFDYWVMTDFMNLFSPKDVKNIDNKTLYYTKNGWSRQNVSKFNWWNTM